MRPEILIVRRWYGYDPLRGVLIRKIKSNSRLSDEISLSTDKRVYLLGKRYPFTHIVWAVHFGRWPNGEIDHIDHNITNNKLSNLREVSSSQNIWNRRPWKDFKGVSFDGSVPRSKPWVARISVHGKSIFLGSFTSEVEAHEAYCQAALKYHGEFACLK